MNRPINNNNNHEDHAEDDIGGNDDPDSPNDDSDQDSDTDTDTDAVFLDDSDDAFDDDNSDEDRHSLGPVPTPEEVDVEYTYPQDFHGRTWEEVIDEFCRVRIDPSCTDIEARKFWGCPLIIELVFPKTCAVTRIQMNAFSHCNNLQQITNGYQQPLPFLKIMHFSAVHHFRVVWLFHPTYCVLVAGVFAVVLHLPVLCSKHQQQHPLLAEHNQHLWYWVQRVFPNVPNCDPCGYHKHGQRSHVTVSTIAPN